MPKQHTVTTHQFDELSEHAKSRAREWYRNGLEFDSEYLLEEAKRLLDLLGFTDAEIYYCGFWSQGDGACFVSSVDVQVLFDSLLGKKSFDGWKWLLGDIDLTSYVNHRHLEWFELILDQLDLLMLVVRCGPSNLYSHENTAYVDWSCYGLVCTETGKRLEAIMKGIEELRRDLCRAIYRALESEYEYQNADEQIDESIRCNEYEFYEDGRSF